MNLVKQREESFVLARQVYNKLYKICSWLQAIMIFNMSVCSVQNTQVLKLYWFENELAWIFWKLLAVQYGHIGSNPFMEF